MPLLSTYAAIIATKANLLRGEPSLKMQLLRLVSVLHHGQRSVFFERQCKRLDDEWLDD